MPQRLHQKTKLQQDYASSSKLTIDVYDAIDIEVEKRLLRKLDFALLPLFGFLFLTNFITRTAIGEL